MLTTIKDILFGIWDFITGIFEFLTSTILELAHVAGFLARAVASIPSYLGFFPAAFGSLLLVLVSVAVIYKLLGREG